MNKQAISPRSRRPSLSIANLFPSAAAATAAVAQRSICSGQVAKSSSTASQFCPLYDSKGCAGEGQVEAEVRVER